MRLRKATGYEQLQWQRYRHTHDDPGLTLSYQFKISGDVDFQILNSVLKSTISNGFTCLLGYFWERGNVLLVGRNRLPTQVLDIVTEESQWTNSEPIDPCGDKLFRFSCFIEDEKIIGLKLEFSHLVFDGECYQSFINTLSDYWNRRESLNDEVREDEDLSFLQIGEAPLTEASVDFWKANLQGMRLSQPLPFCFRTPKGKGVYLTLKRTLAINPKQGAKSTLEGGSISSLLKQRGLTMFQFVVAVTATVTRLYSVMKNHDEETITIAHTVNCRGGHQAYGCFTNLIPLFVKVNLDQTGAELLTSVQQKREAVRPHRLCCVIRWN